MNDDVSTMRRMLDVIKQGIVTLSSEGLILYSNMYFAEMLNTDIEFIAGSNIFQFIAPDEISSFELDLNKHLTEGNYETALLASDDNLVPVSIAFYKLEENDLITLVVSDLRDGYKLDSEIQTLKKKLASITRAKDALVLGLSDNIRTSVNSLIINIKKELESKNTPENPNLNFLNSLLKQIRGVLSSVNYIKDFAMIEIGSVVPKLDTLSIDDLVDQTLSSIKLVPEYSSLKVNSKFPSTPLVIRTDRRIMLKLFQAVFVKTVQLSKFSTCQVVLNNCSNNALNDNVSGTLEITTEGELDPAYKELLVNFFPTKDLTYGMESGQFRIILHLIQSLASLCNTSVTFITRPDNQVGFILKFPY